MAEWSLLLLIRAICRHSGSNFFFWKGSWITQWISCKVICCIFQRTALYLIFYELLWLLSVRHFTKAATFFTFHWQSERIHWKDISDNQQYRHLCTVLSVTLVSYQASLQFGLGEFLIFVRPEQSVNILAILHAIFLTCVTTPKNFQRKNKNNNEYGLNYEFLTEI